MNTSSISCNISIFLKHLVQHQYSRVQKHFNLLEMVQVPNEDKDYSWANHIPKHGLLEDHTRKNESAPIDILERPTIA